MFGLFVSKGVGGQFSDSPQPPKVAANRYKTPGHGVTQSSDFFDKNWNACDKDNAKHVVYTEYDESGNVVYSETLSK